MTRPIVASAKPSTAEVDSIADFQSRLRDWLAEFCEARGLDPSISSGRDEVWQLDDIEPFMRSLELFQSLTKGAFRWQRGYAKLGLFGHGSKASNPRPATLSRETIAVMGAVADLHQGLHWPAELIEVETKGYVFDFAAYRRDANDTERMVIAGEAKRSLRELETWLADLLDCIALGVHGPAEHLALTHSGVRLNAHKKWQGLAENRPDYLWLVALGARRAFRLTYVGESVVLREVGPTPSVDFNSLTE